jgi:hypothetical protein
MVPLSPALPLGEAEYAEHVAHLHELLWDVAAQALTADGEHVVDLLAAPDPAAESTVRMV